MTVAIAPCPVQTVCVLGLGYIGLPTAAMLATHGFRVTGVDVNPAVRDAIREGSANLREPGVGAVVQRALQSGSLTIASEPEPADVFILAVPTPLAQRALAPNGEWALTDGGAAPVRAEADLSFVAAAAEATVPHLRPGALVVLESTSPPGTTAHLVRHILESSGLSAGEDFSLVYCPERVLPGRILIELVHNSRVIGGIDLASAERARDLYASFVEGEMVLTDTTTAEMVKLMENTYRDVNIALANEFALVSEEVMTDVWEAIAIANRHPRVNILNPGPGVGGHCIAVDPLFIVEAAPERARLIRTAREVNDAQPGHVVEAVRRSVADLPHPTIAVLGLAYKADVDDLRESPALHVAQLLGEHGCTVRLHDACAQRLPDGTALEPDLRTVLAGADAAVILTDHSVYRQLKPGDAGPLAMAHRRLTDTRRCIDHALWEREGFVVHQLGVGARPGASWRGEGSSAPAPALPVRAGWWPSAHRARSAER
ncbi:MAG: nucleotide sugar dehydrogenase [Chloroflexota bacterium]|nr:nucleotide sugar dehydrogenase [Chloroflexota bacterium]